MQKFKNLFKLELGAPKETKFLLRENQVLLQNFYSVHIFYNVME